MSVDTKELRSFHGWTVRTDSERLDMLRAAADCIDSQAAEIEQLRGALEAMLDIHGVTQSYAEKHIDIPQSWVEVSDIARAALSGEPT